jgi:hypothetical protein
MMVFRTLMVAILVSVLPACSTTPADGSGKMSGQNPFEYCSAQGIDDGTEEYNNCVNEYIHKYCTGQGAEPGTETYRKCASSLREATFLRDQMQIRGF